MKAPHRREDPFPLSGVTTIGVLDDFIRAVSSWRLRKMYSGSWQ